MSIVNGNQLERKATLNFSFFYGGCTVLNQITIVLCFQHYETNVCRQSNNPFGSFIKLPSSNFYHSRARISSFEGKIKFYWKSKLYPLDTFIAVGDLTYKHTHVELFTLSTSSSKWQTKKDYPYSKDIGYYSILAVEKKVHYIWRIEFKKEGISKSRHINNMIMLL